MNRTPYAPTDSRLAPSSVGSTALMVDGRLDEVTVRALDLVVDANGDLGLWFAISASALEGRRQAVARFVRRAGSELVEENGSAEALVVIPAAEGVELCRAFCRRQPATVHAHLLGQERRIACGQVPAGGARTAASARDLVRSWIEIA
ncbi:MAG TPA: hypothetical protein VIY72_09815 [Acidimicrobiales bacterium]